MIKRRQKGWNENNNVFIYVPTLSDLFFDCQDKLLLYHPPSFAALPNYFAIFSLYGAP